MVESALMLDWADEPGSGTSDSSKPKGRPRRTGTVMTDCRRQHVALLVQRSLLWAVDVGWEQATEAEAETATLVGWLRSAPNPQRRRRRAGGLAAGTVNPKTGKPALASGYAP
jgi:hypothetical protein